MKDNGEYINIFDGIEFTYSQRTSLIEKLRRAGYRAYLFNDYITEIEIQAIWSDLNYAE